MTISWYTDKFNSYVNSQEYERVLAERDEARRWARRLYRELKEAKWQSWHRENDLLRQLDQARRELEELKANTQSDSGLG